MSDLEASELFDLDKTWHVDTFLLDDSGFLIDELSPLQVPLLKHSSSSVHLWPVAVKSRSEAGPQSQQSAWDQLLFGTQHREDGDDETPGSDVEPDDVDEEDPDPSIEELENIVLAAEAAES